MLNPVITSLRALCHVSHCEKMRQVCSSTVVPGQFLRVRAQGFQPDRPAGGRWPSGSTAISARYHALLEQLRDRGVHFVFRLKDNVILESAGPERTLTAQDRQAGVVWDRQMRLGHAAEGPVFRVVRVEAGGEVVQLVTTREDLPADLIGLIYRPALVQIELLKNPETDLGATLAFGKSLRRISTDLFSPLPAIKEIFCGDGAASSALRGFLIPGFGFPIEIDDEPDAASDSRCCGSVVPMLRVLLQVKSLGINRVAGVAGYSSASYICGFKVPGSRFKIAGNREPKVG